MALQLEGPSPIDGAVRTVHTSADNRLMVAAKSNVRGFYVSRDDARLFSATFRSTVHVAGSYIAYIKNTSNTRNMFIDLIRVGGDANARWTLVKATGSATGGSTASATNYNLGSGITAEAALARAGVAGFTVGSTLTVVRSLANTTFTIPFDDTLILTPQTAFAVQYDTGSSGVAEAWARFFYEDIGDS